LDIFVMSSRSPRWVRQFDASHGLRPDRLDRNHCTQATQSSVTLWRHGLGGNPRRAHPRARIWVLGPCACGGFYCQAERGCVAGDQPRAAAISEPGPDPVEEDRHPAAKADQEKDVDDAPEHPGDWASQLDPAEIGDRRVAADRGERALVA